MDAKNDISARFIKAYDELLSRKKVVDKKDFANKLGISASMVTEISKGRSNVGTLSIQNIVLQFGVNAEWLLTGQGDMLDAAPSLSLNPSIGTPYYDVDFLGGFSEIFNNQTTVPTCNILVPGFEKASLWCNVTGHSMEPKINHGDIIALHECTINDIQYGEIYAVVLDTIRTIKILRRGSEPGKLLYVPINKPDYQEQEFDISRIVKIFEVVGAISKFF